MAIPRLFSNRAETTGADIVRSEAATRMNNRSVRLNVRDATGMASAFWLVSVKPRAVRPQHLRSRERRPADPQVRHRMPR